MRSHRLVISIAVLLTLPLTFAAAPANQPAEDLRESQLLSSTYYSDVSAQKMMDGARDALAAAVRKHGVRLTLPDLRDSGNSDANISAIAQAIARVQSATHESGTDLTYGAIDGMTRSIGDRYTAFFTPDEFREFNQALDPEKISGIGVLIQPDPGSKFIRAYYVVPGTPAERAGLQSGDVFTRIGGIDKRIEHGRCNQSAAR